MLKRSHTIGGCQDVSPVCIFNCDVAQEKVEILQRQVGMILGVHRAEPPPTPYGLHWHGKPVLEHIMLLIYLIRQYNRRRLSRVARCSWWRSCPESLGMASRALAVRWSPYNKLQCYGWLRTNCTRDTRGPELTQVSRLYLGMGSIVKRTSTA